MAEKYYRNVYVFELLSTEEMESMDLSQLDYEASEGHCSGMFLDGVTEEVDENTMARLLLNQGSDPEFLLGNGDGEECPNCECGTIERADTEARCGECGHVWDLRYLPKERQVIFLALHNNKYWTLVHHPVPVEVRMDQMQAWADEHLAPKLGAVGYFKLFPYEEAP